MLTRLLALCLVRRLPISSSGVSCSTGALTLQEVLKLPVAEQVLVLRVPAQALAALAPLSLWARHQRLRLAKHGLAGRSQRSRPA